MTDTDDEIVFGREGGLGTVLLNRPKALNALTHEMCVALDKQLRDWATDGGIKAVLVKGAGEKAFCAGGDIRKLYDEGRAGGRYPYDFYHDEYITNALIHYFPKPYVSFLDGIVMGGGCGVSIPGSHRIATERVMFAMPETGIGLFPDVGGSFFLSRCPGRVGEYLALTGARLKAADCVHAGVADWHVPSDRLIELETALKDADLTDFERASAVIATFAADPGEAPLAQMQTGIDRLFSGDSVEAILAALDDDGGEWAAKQASIIRAKSPTSSKIALRQVREGAKRDFHGCMQMEWRMVNRIIAGHDFYEGTRATVIDKDQAPKWQPPSLEQVSEADVDAYFAPLDDGDLKFD
ncbi:MAG: enoyl-CoA hydratase/isomerase family protein [Minwuia sp.]|uniref:enoyl-CoA hydratase/isomerase family protein n=1 Tax=Minwuia sp. TaxID=2493630 RepID=UPI003A8B5F83